MSSLTTALISAGCIFVGGLTGMWLRKRLPDHHLAEASKDTIKVGSGILASLAALVLGLLISSAKSSFDATTAGIAQGSAKIILLDRENEQGLLRRGLVPPRELPSVNRQRPHFVADLYRRQCQA